MISATGTLAEVNPIRYRGYYYDNETGLYYLQSRYYDPMIGRFVNADGYASTGQSILGYDMYVYCGNNPISNLDSDGYRYVAAHRLEDETSEERSISCQHQNRISRPSPEESALMRLENSGVTTYNNVPVIRVPIKGNVGFSAGVIFLGEGVKNNPDGIETLMHEYGHAVHLSQIGWESYYSFVLCPSLINYWKGVEYSDYYSQPWEYIADVLGNVARTDNGQPYVYDPNARQAAYEYWQFTIEYDGISSIY